MLTKFDDYPIHQTSEPIAVVATTDRHAYDRYWFNGYQDDGEFYFGIGCAVYPNLGIVDCGLSIVHGGRQYAFHGSRRAGLERSEIEVGPFRLEILEPMKSLRVTLDDNETGISASLLWIPRTASFAEGHQRSVRNPHAGAFAHMEATRFNQFGHWQGEIRYPGGGVKVDPARVLGTKDRSWGIRPVGDPAPPGAPPTKLPQVFFLWAPLHFDTRCTHAGIFENEHGIQWHWDGMIMPAYKDPNDLPGVEDPRMEPLAAVEHRLEFVPGTRRARHAVITLVDLTGARTEIDLEPLLLYRMKGIGYSHPEWGHGKWKGELAIGGESWKIEDADEKDISNQHIQQVVRAKATGPNGVEHGIGVLEQIHLGPHKRYGFKDFMGPAA